MFNEIGAARRFSVGLNNEVSYQNFECCHFELDIEISKPIFVFHY